MRLGPGSGLGGQTACASSVAPASACPPILWVATSQRPWEAPERGPSPEASGAPLGPCCLGKLMRKGSRLALASCDGLPRTAAHGVGGKKLEQTDLNLGCWSRLPCLFLRTLLQTGRVPRHGAHHHAGLLVGAGQRRGPAACLPSSVSKAGASIPPAISTWHVPSLASAGARHACHLRDARWGGHHRSADARRLGARAQR